MVKKMSAEELKRRFEEADRARLVLRRCTIEMRAAGAYMLAERAREAKRPHGHSPRHR